MRSHEILQYAILGVLALVGIFVAFKVGRRWRREYKGAIAYRTKLENDNVASAEALSDLRAQVSSMSVGNSVEVNVGDRSPVSPGDQRDVGGAVPRGVPGVWVPDSVRRGSDRWALLRGGIES